MGFKADLRDALWPSGDLGQRLLTLVFLALLPAASGVAVALASLSLTSTMAVLSPLAIMAAGQLTSFVYLANLRLKLSEYESERRTAELAERKMVDSAVAGLLAGAVTSASSALVLAVIAMTTTGMNGFLTGTAAVAVVVLTCFSFGMFMVSLPNLWSAYTQVMAAERTRRSLVP